MNAGGIHFRPQRRSGGRDFASEAPLGIQKDRLLNRFRTGKTNPDEGRSLPRRSGPEFLQSSRSPAQDPVSQCPTRNHPITHRCRDGNFPNSRHGGFLGRQNEVDLPLPTLCKAAAINCRCLAQAAPSGPCSKPVPENDRLGGQERAGSIHRPCSLMRSTRRSTASSSGMLNFTACLPT